ncbi:MAG: helix-turn-helix domain-containing protein [Lentimicrobium sp.]
MDNLIITSLSRTELKALVKESIIELEVLKQEKVESLKSYSIAALAKMLGRSHSTIKNLIKAGKLKTTADGRRITHQALQDYLSTESK